MCVDTFFKLRKWYQTVPNRNHHIKSNLLIGRVNELTGFQKMRPLNHHQKIVIIIDIKYINNSENINSSNVFKTKISTAQKMKLSIKDFFSKCDQIPRKLTEEIPKGKIHFLCSLVCTFFRIHAGQMHWCFSKIVLTVEISFFQ